MISSSLFQSIYQHVTSIVLVWYPHNMDIWWLIFTWSSIHHSHTIKCSYNLSTKAWSPKPSMGLFLLFDDRAFGPSNDAYPKLKAIWANCLYQVLATYNSIDCNWPLHESNQICDSNGGDKDSGTGRDSPKLNTNCILIKCPKLSLVTQIEFNEFEQLYDTISRTPKKHGNYHIINSLMSLSYHFIARMMTRKLKYRGA